MLPDPIQLIAPRQEHLMTAEEIERRFEVSIVSTRLKKSINPLKYDVKFVALNLCILTGYGDDRKEQPLFAACSH